MSLIVETDIREILEKMDRKSDAFIEKVDRRFDALEQDISSVKISISELKGEVKVLATKVENLSQRIENQEFISRSIFASLIVVILGGLIKMFGLLPSNIS